MVKDSDWHIVVTKYRLFVSLLALTVAGSYFDDSQRTTAPAIYTPTCSPSHLDSGFCLGMSFGQWNIEKCLHIEIYPLGMLTLTIIPF